MTLVARINFAGSGPRIRSVPLTVGMGAIDIPVVAAVVVGVGVGDDDFGNELLLSLRLLLFTTLLL